jgi:hypothetical protein
MRTPCRVALLVLAGLGAVTGTARAAEPSNEPAAEQVREAVQKGIVFLKGKCLAPRQLQAGAWELSGYLEWGGATALGVLALLETGAKPDDVDMAAALDYLGEARPGLTFGVSLQTQVLCRAGRKKDAHLIQHNVDELLQGARRARGRLVGWDRGKGEYYGKTPPITASDTEFAVVALHAASQAGARVEEKTWKKIRAHYLETQDPDGGWSDPRTTCAAICGLLITAQELRLEGDEPLRPVTKAVDYLTSHFRLPQGGSGFPELDLLDALARVRRLAGKDLPAAQQDALRVCYRKGVELLLKEQARDGSWGDKAWWLDTFRTSQGLIFLAEIQRKP